jgi:hypothetical protein
MSVTKLRETPEPKHDGRLPDTIMFVPKSMPVRVSFMGTDCLSVAQALQKTFGPFPIQLARYEHEQALVAMHAATGFVVYEELLNGLRTYNEIEVRLS